MSYRYNKEADEELDRLYASVGSTTPSHKVTLLMLIMGEANFYASGEITDEMKQGCLEQEYLISKNLIIPKYC